MTWRSWATERRTEISRAGRWRTLRDLESLDPTRVRLPDGRTAISFATNDYLGLSFHPEVVAAAMDATRRSGSSSSSARLIAGSRAVHSELEEQIAGWKGTESALLFPSGYSANLGVLDVVGTPERLICSDELNHASIIDGCRLARARVAVYPHADIAALERLVEGEREPVIVSDAVFSMDGDATPLDALQRVAGQAGALLILDEAHSVLSAPPSIAGDTLRVGTLSKFLASSGGFVAGPGEIIELLVNAARSFIFSTALAPASVAAALAALTILRSDEGEALRTHLRALVDRIAPAHPSPIVPLVVGDERRAVELSERLLDRGLLVPAIRPPSVPLGASRLRISLSAAHSDDDVGVLLEELEALGALTYA